jgi:bifunctional DNase/RNase
MTLRQQIVQDHIDKTYYAALVTSQLCYASFRKWNGFEIYSRIIRSWQ